MPTESAATVCYDCQRSTSGHCWRHGVIGWTFDPPLPCGGISVNGAEPPVCEVHLAPWGHARPECVQ